MNYAKAILFSSVILASAIVFAAHSQVSSQMSSGRYMIAGDGSQFVWRVNVETGAVDYCVRRDNSSDPGLIEKRPPYCSKSTPGL